MSTPKTVLLSGDPLFYEAKAKAGEAIKPGHLVEVVGGELRKHANASKGGSTAFAREAAYVGDTIDTAYADGENVPYMVARKGDRVYAFLEAGATVAQGDLLESNGLGEFQPHTPGVAGTQLPGVELVKAAEAVNNSAGGSAVRIRVEVL